MAWIFGTLRLTSIPDTETDFLCHQIGNFLSDVKKVKQAGIQKLNRSRKEVSQGYWYNFRSRFYFLRMNLERRRVCPERKSKWSGGESIPEPLGRGAEPYSANTPHPYGSVDESQPRERWSEGYTR